MKSYLLVHSQAFVCRTYRWVPALPDCRRRRRQWCQGWRRAEKIYSTTATVTNIAVFSYKEWNEPVFPVALNGLLQFVPAKAQVLIALNVPMILHLCLELWLEANLNIKQPYFHQPNEPGLFHRWMRLVRAIRDQSAVDLGILNLRKNLLVPE